MLDAARYALQDIDTLQTPALVYYRDFIRANTKAAIDRAGGAQRLWPHVKSHKMAAMIDMQLQMGIRRFKCATIAEAQMVAECGGEHILLAYPLVGPNIGRFIALTQAYPAASWYAIGDDAGQIAALGTAAKAANAGFGLLIDVNMGMNRTGAPLDTVEALYKQCAALEGIRMAGLHCYDGHIHHPDLTERGVLAQAALNGAHTIRRRLEEAGIPCPNLIMGGTPTFPVHAQTDGVYLSPGTVFLGDAKCMKDVPDLAITPAAGIWTRVISHPAPGLFTLDLGVKGISTDQKERRGLLVGLPGATPLFQSEEHWVWQMPEATPVPPIGEAFFVIPEHICPATALYPFASIASEGRLVDRWQVTARDRSIGI